MQENRDDTYVLPSGGEICLLSAIKSNALE